MLLVLLGCGQAPVVAFVSPSEGDAVVVGEPIAFVATVEDEDPGEVRLTLSADPGGELDVETTFDGDTVTMLYSRALVEGPVTLTLTGTDPGGLAGRDTLDLTVVENTPPTITLLTDTSSLAVGVSLDVSVQVSDPDEPDPGVLALTWIGAEGPAFADSDGTATGTAVFWTEGLQTVSVTVADPGGAIATVDLPLDVFQDDDDLDGWTDTSSGGLDCDDDDPAISPDADETCDGIDEDCDGVVDDDPVDGSTRYVDADGDGWGAGAGVSACDTSDGYSASNADCDDTSADVSPGSPETCDGRDEDCDGAVDEDPGDGGSWYADADGDGYGDDGSVIVSCEAASGATSTGGDCDDTDPDVSPGAAEVCDTANTDEDCDGLADDADASATGKRTYYRDSDGDGYGSTATSSRCDAGAGYAATSADCDDARAASHPGAAEVCENGEDDDCDGDDATCAIAGTVGLADADARWVGATANDFAGACAGVGDQDGDGLPDIVIGTWGRTGGATGSGVMFVVSGADAGGLLTAGLGWRKGIAADDAVGWSVDGAGDLDGDGWDDMIAGGYGADTGGAEAGAAYIIAGPVSTSASLSSTKATLVGESAGDAAGWAVAGGGDTDGDGDVEVLVGATGSNGGGSDSGRVYLLEGPLSRTIDLSAADSIVTGDAASDAAGYAVAFADVDADGFDDVVVGGTGASSGAGAAWVVLGPLAATVDLGSADAKRTGVTAGDAAGSSVADAGDTDGDGYGDVIVGAPQVDTAGSEAGAAYLLLGPLSGTSSLSRADAVLTGVSAQDRAGTAVGGGGDADADGFDDVLVGAYYESTVGTGAGAAYLLYGPLSGTVSLGAADATLQGESARDAAGRHVTFAGDTDGDGFDDVLVGATGYGSGAGAVYVLRGGDG